MLCCKHGFSEASYYLWQSKFGGMDVSDAKRLKAIEADERAATEAVGRVGARERGHARGASKTMVTAPVRHELGAVDANEGPDGAPRACGRRHERELVALPAAHGSQRGTASTDHRSGAASSALRRRPDPPEV